MKKKIFQVIVILILISFIVGTTRQIIKLNQASDKFERAKAKLENLQSENGKLKEELKFRETPEFVEQAAREKLGLVKEGETVVILPKVEEGESQEVKKESGLKFWFERLFGG